MIGVAVGWRRCLRHIARLGAAGFVALSAAPRATLAQSPLRHWTDARDTRFAESQPVIVYTLRVDSADVSGFDVAMSVRGKRDTIEK